MPGQRITCEQFARIEELRNPPIRSFDVVPSDVSPNVVQFSQCFGGSRGGQNNGLQPVEDFAEIPHAGGLMRKPLGGADSAQGKAAATVGIVAEFDKVAVAGCGDYVFAFRIADPVRRDFDLGAGSSDLDNFFQRDRRARWRVELGGVMRLGDGKFVTVKFSQVSCEAK